MKKLGKIIATIIQAIIIFGAALCIGVAMEGEAIKPLSYILCCVVVILQSISIILGGARS